MPMNANEIEKLIKAGIPDAEVTIRDLAGDGDHYAATVMAESFRGKSRVQQHQLVYEALKGQMGGALHALALQTGLAGRRNFGSTDAAQDNLRAEKDEDHGHRAVHRQRSEEQRRGAVHEGHAAVPDVRLFRPGRADPRLPRRALQRAQRAGERRPAERHQDLFELADHPAALRQGRIRRRLRHRPRDVPGRRIAVADEGKGPAGEGPTRRRNCSAHSTFATKKGRPQGGLFAFSNAPCCDQRE